MAAYVTTAHVDGAINTTERQVLFSTDETTANYSSTFFDQEVALASAVVQSAAHNAGYTSLGATTTSDIIIDLTRELLLLRAYRRKGLIFPERFGNPEERIAMLRDGKMPIPDIAPDARDAVGGVQFTEQSATISTGRPPIFTRDKLDGSY